MVHDTPSSTNQIWDSYLKQDSSLKDSHIPRHKSPITLKCDLDFGVYIAESWILQPTQWEEHLSDV